MREQHDLELVLKSHFPIVTIETHEEGRVIELLRKVSPQIGKPVFTWTSTNGLNAEDIPSNGKNYDAERLTRKARYSAAGNDTLSPSAMLAAVKSLSNAVIVLIDFHHYLEEPVNVRHLKEIALDNHNNHLSIVLLSHGLDLPDDLGRFCASFELTLPDQDKLRALIREEAKVWNLRHPNEKVKGDNRTLDRFIHNLTGLTESDSRRLIRNAIYDDGAITDSDIPEVASAKYELLGQDGVLTFEYDTASFSDVGGFSSLKRWLDIRKQYVTSNDQVLDRPKGILLLGVQGGGKSLAAKAVAGAWGLPLLRFDFGALYNKFYGETEKNIRESLKAAQVMAPCVLWMDEIEKGIATGDYDSGTSRRVLATLLTWMAENKEAVFIVATANDIQALPPELVRKGRFDEIFFVDLPSLSVRKEIFAIHLHKRSVPADGIDLDQLAKLSEGFSGAEIEQAVVAAMYTASAGDEKISDQHISQEITQTRPLSRVMYEQVSSLREWASGRTVLVE